MPSLPTIVPSIRELTHIHLKLAGTMSCPEVFYVFRFCSILLYTIQLGHNSLATAQHPLTAYSC
jgi:hypothetical protein